MLDEETREGVHLESGAGNPPVTSAPKTDSASAHEGTAFADAYSNLKQAAQERKHLAELDKRFADMQELEALYARWDALAAEQKQVHQRELIEACVWILVLLML